MPDSNPRGVRQNPEARRHQGGKTATPSRGIKDPRRVGRWVLVACVWLLILPVWFLFFVVTAVYLSPVFGGGWPWIGASLVFAMGLPMVLGMWLVRPLDGFKRAAWLTGTCLIVPLLGVLGLSAGLPRVTGPRLRSHGKPLFEQVFGKVTQSRVSRTGVDLVAWWADLLHRTTRTASDASPTAPHRMAGSTSRPEPVLATRDVHFAGMDQNTSESVPEGPQRGPTSQVRFILRGGAIMLRGEASANQRAAVELVFDPETPLSAVTRETAITLGLPVPTHPVPVELDVMGGRHSFPLSVVGRFRIGRAELDHVTVAICDPCVPSGLSGRIGRNFTRHFVSSPDPKKRQMTLQARGGPRNRIHDALPFLEIVSERGRVEGERFTTEGILRNRSPRHLRELRLTAVLLDTHDRVLHRHETVIPKVAAQEAAPFTIVGEAPGALIKYRLEPTSVLW